MDCEKLQTVIMDELYGELDEVTSAAVKRHAAGCPDCAAKLTGLRATRKLATIPLVEPPAGLEARILAAARIGGAAALPPPRGRVSSAISIAGRWSMRPKTAMAALFLLMLGVSGMLLQ